MALAGLRLSASAASDHLVGGLLHHFGVYFPSSLLGRLVAGPTWSSPNRVEAGFRWLVRGRRLGFFDKIFDETVIAVGQCVPALIAVEGWGEATDENALSYPSLMPIGLTGEDLDISFAEVVMRIRGVLHYSRFE